MTMTCLVQLAYLAGKRDGLARAEEVIGAWNGPQPTPSTQPPAGNREPEGSLTNKARHRRSKAQA